MKYVVFMACVLVSAGLLGCSQEQAERAAHDTKDATTDAAKEVGDAVEGAAKGVAGAAGDVAEGVGQAWDSLKGDVSKDLQAMEEKVSALKASASKLGNAEADKLVAELDDKLKACKDKVASFKPDQGDMDKFKAELDEDMRGITSAYESLEGKVKDLGGALQSIGH